MTDHLLPTLVYRPSVPVMEKTGLVFNRVFHHLSLSKDHPLSRHVPYSTGG